MTGASIIIRYDGFRLKNNDWAKYLTRDLHLIIIYYIEYSTAYYFEKFGVIPLDEVIYKSKEGVVEIWRPAKSYERTLDSIQAKFRGDPNSILRIIAELEKLTDKLEDLSKKDINKKEKLKFLDKINKLFKDYMDYYAFVIFFGYKFNEEDKKRFPEINKRYEAQKQKTQFKNMEEIYLRFGISLFGKEGSIVNYITPSELRKMISKGHFDTRLAKERHEKYFFYGTKRKRYILTKKDADIGIKMLMENRKIFESSEDIKGTPVFQGKAEGKVFLAFSEREYKNIKEDCILVTPMTTPWLIPYMEKVKGIVTDEGGLGSHAAIVARERKIPCIVGTRDATEKLKTGDRIELDTYKGIVRKLK